MRREGYIHCVHGHVGVDGTAHSFEEACDLIKRALTPSLARIALSTEMAEGLGEGLGEWGWIWILTLMVSRGWPTRVLRAPATEEAKISMRGGSKRSSHGEEEEESSLI